MLMAASAFSVYPFFRIPTGCSLRLRALASK
jgi:hypothetical protein